ncbi:MAG: apolipoprotein N-acyltransferase [Ruminococcaceae bacterium]|nr:apolipoprotein N-acyltransferase [Oscillospiraceae bacterium]
MKTGMKHYLESARLSFMLIGAILTGLTLVFPVLGFLQWFTMIPIFIGVYRMAEDRSVRLRRAYLYGFLTVFAYYFVIYHWFCALYPLDFAGLDPASAVVVIIAGWAGLSLLQAIPGGFVFLFYKLLQKNGAFERVPVLRPIAFSALWIIFEWSSTLHWTGVPWGRLCLGQASYLPMLQSASLFGSYFISLLILLVNGLLAYAILYCVGKIKKVRLLSLCAASLVLLNLLLGCCLMALNSPSNESVRVAVVQGNISSHEKWGENSRELTKEIYGEKTRLAAKEGAQIVLWPETAFPNRLNASFNSDLLEFVTDLARECEVTLVIGALYEDSEGGEYNALYWIDPDGSVSEDVYAKRHLVPFGEYVPMRELITALIPPLADLSVLQSDLSAGSDPALFESSYGRIGSLICFDSIYEQLTLDSVREGAKLMLLSSNDSWFFDSAAIYQHEAQARLRAIENGRYLVRSGNTGISSIVSNTGEHLVYIDPLVDGYGVADVELRETQTLYTHVGNLLVYACIGFCATLLALGWIDSYKKRREEILK